jgi:hypothetical protein
METASRIAFAAFFVLAGLSCAAAAQEWREAGRRIPAQIQATESALAGLKDEMLRWHQIIRGQVLDAGKDYETWDRTSRLESNPSLKAAMALHRDGFNAHAKSLVSLHESFVDLGRLGEDLESDQSGLRLVQQIVESNVNARRSATPRDLEGLTLLVRSLQLRQQQLKNVYAAASRRAAILKDHDREVRALLSGMGPSGDRVKQFERQMVETELRRNDMEKRHLGALTGFAGRMLELIEKTASTLEAQDRILRAI